MSWMGGGGVPWESEWSGGNGEEEAVKPKPFYGSLKPIEISKRYKALEEEDEGSEHESDNEPGNMLKPSDLNSKADRVCPSGGIRNHDQERCDCGMGIHWPIETGESLDGLHRCRGYRSKAERKVQRNQKRWPKNH